MSKINVWRIVRDHLDTLVDYPSTRLSGRDSLLFIVSPLILALAVAALGLDFKAEVLNGLLTAFAIFAGLLLNLLVLVFTNAQSSPQPGPVDPRAPNRRRLLREIHANISFAILVSFAMVIVTVLALWHLKEAKPTLLQGVIRAAFSFTITALACNFALTLLMVLKRMHILIADQFNTPNLKKTA